MRAAPTDEDQMAGVWCAMNLTTGPVRSVDGLRTGLGLDVAAIN